LEKISNKEVSQFSIALIVVIVSILFLFKVLYYSQYGLDFTDEGCNLNWISNPWIYNASISSYGFFYYPMCFLSGGSIVKLRYLNVLITFFLSSMVFFYSLKNIVERKIAFIAFPFACAGLLIFRPWATLTPDYNSLTCHGMLAVLLSLLIFREDSRRLITSGVLLGCGGVVTFIGKPSSAMLLPIFVLIFMTLFRCFSWRMLWIAASTAIVLLVSFTVYADGTPFAFIHRFQRGMEKDAILVCAHTVWEIFKISPVPLDLAHTILFLLVFIASFFITCLLLFNIKISKSLLNIITLALTCFSFLIVLGLCSSPQMTIRKDLFSLMFLLFSFGVAASFAYSLALSKQMKIEAFCRIFAPLSLYVFFNYIYAFGTNYNYWNQGEGMATLWILPILELITSFHQTIDKQKITAFMTTVSAFILFMAILLINTGMDNPYRQPYALKHYTGAVAALNSAEKIIVSKETENYLVQLQILVKDNGFKSGMPMIDLTGRYPASLYFIGAKAIGAPWILGNYAGSLEFAIVTLAAVKNEDLKEAWLLTEPDGPRAIPFAALTANDLSLERDYVLIGSLMNNEGKFRQDIYKPK